MMAIYVNIANRRIRDSIQSQTWFQGNVRSSGCCQNTERYALNDYFSPNSAHLISAGIFDQQELNNFIEESLIMSKLKHTHVMGLIGVCIDAGSAPYIVMPYMANGSLLTYLKKQRKNLILDVDSDEDEVSYNFYAKRKHMFCATCCLLM